MDKEDKVPPAGKPAEEAAKPEDQAPPVSMDHLFQLMLQEEGADLIAESDGLALPPDLRERLARERAALIERLRKQVSPPADPDLGANKDAGS